MIVLSPSAIVVWLANHGDIRRKLISLGVGRNPSYGGWTGHPLLRGTSRLRAPSRPTSSFQSIILQATSLRAQRAVTRSILLHCCLLYSVMEWSIVSALSLLLLLRSTIECIGRTIQQGFLRSRWRLSPDCMSRKICSREGPLADQFGRTR